MLLLLLLFLLLPLHLCNDPATPVHCHTFVPLGVIIAQLVEYLQAPVPFVMGMPTSFLYTREVLESLTSSVVVQIDTDTVRKCALRAASHVISCPCRCLLALVVAASRSCLPCLLTVVCSGR